MEALAGERKSGSQFLSSSSTVQPRGSLEPQPDRQRWQSGGGCAVVGPTAQTTLRAARSLCHVALQSSSLPHMCTKRTITKTLGRSKQLTSRWAWLGRRPTRWATRESSLGSFFFGAPPPECAASFSCRPTGQSLARHARPLARRSSYSLGRSRRRGLAGLVFPHRPRPRLRRNLDTEVSAPSVGAHPTDENRMEMGVLTLRTSVYETEGPRLGALGGPSMGRLCKRRAGDGARTRDIRLGRPTLYQLSYSRTSSASLAARDGRR